MIPDMREPCRPPRPPRGPSRGGGLFFGGLLVLAGTAFLLSQLGLLGGYDVWDFWPLILVLMGIFRLVRARTGAGRVWGLVLLAGGTLAQLHVLDVIALEWRIVWPIMIILVGVLVAVHSLIHRRRRSPEPLSEDQLDIKVMFGGRQERVDSQEFVGGRISCTMGGCELDLRDARMKDDSATLDIRAVMGGVEMYVPRDWNVQVKGAPVMGSFEDKTRPADRDGPTLVIEGDVIMGGVEIRN
jgi:predicted membrane protein